MKRFAGSEPTEDEGQGQSDTHFFKNLFLDKVISLLGVDDNGGVVGAHGKL